MRIRVISPEARFGRQGWIAEQLQYEASMYGGSTIVSIGSPAEWDDAYVDVSNGIVAELMNHDKQIARSLHRAVLLGKASLAFIPNGAAISEYFPDFVQPSLEYRDNPLPPTAYYLAPSESDPIHQLSVQLGSSSGRALKLKVWHQALRAQYLLRNPVEEP